MFFKKIKGTACEMKLILNGCGINFIIINTDRMKNFY